MDQTIGSKLNCRLFPDEANTYDSLAEICLKIGDLELALRNYEKALELDPKLDSAKTGIKKINILLKK